jgi:hypothetical protein
MSGLEVWIPNLDADLDELNGGERAAARLRLETAIREAIEECDETNEDTSVHSTIIDTER